jgi:D-alanyl-D-alanine carboxypeptidase/D-alanyl-D-alanine-endopeptidase (penicillin-binding protein 4)
MRVPGLLLSLLLLLAPHPAPAGQAPDLPERLQARLAEPRFEASRWGVHVVSLDTGRTLAAHDAGSWFVPASNAKLFTCAAALRILGPDRTLATSLLAPARPGARGVVPGDLILFGRGDPFLLGRWRGGAGRPDPLESLARQAWEAGVRVVEGDLVGDDSFFDTRPWGSGWEAGDRELAFGADVSALTVHENMVDLRIYPGSEAGRPCFLFPQPGLGLLPLANRTTTGQGPALRARWAGSVLEVTGALPPQAAPAALTAPVREPALFAAQLLRRALERRGIRILGATRAAHAGDRGRPLDPAPLAELGRVESEPVRELVKATLKDSVNLGAQLLLLQMGHSEAAGLEAVSGFLRRAGINGVLLEEGSGLSRKDLVKPEALTALLATMATQPEGAAFAAALPVAAVDGTLRGRFGNSAAGTRLRAKTGTLRNTSALAGYATSAHGERLAFAILLNNHVPAPDGPSGQAEVDALAAMLVE